MEEEERLQQYGRVNGKPFELSQEIFISKTDCNVFSKIEKFVSKRSNLKKFWKQTAKVNLRYWLYFKWPVTHEISNSASKKVDAIFAKWQTPLSFKDPQGLGEQWN